MPLQPTPIFSNIDKNVEFIKVKYNSMINSDIIMRNFSIAVKGKSYRALLVGIDGMIDSGLINNSLLKPLMDTAGTSMNAARAS